MTRRLQHCAATVMLSCVNVGTVCMSYARSTLDRTRLHVNLVPIRRHRTLLIFTRSVGVRPSNAFLCSKSPCTCMDAIAFALPGVARGLDSPVLSNTNENTIEKTSERQF